MKTVVALVAAFSLVTVQYCLGDTFGNGANTFEIEFVTIGNPGNVADTTGNPIPAGSVPHTFRMGKFEISEQVIDRANALGSLRITKNTRGPDKPATSVSWSEAARFVNWLNSSTGNPPAYKFAIQPGQVGYDANANIQLWSPSDAGYDPTNRYRNRLAKYFLPSTHEWYKAAYYDPSGNIYYDYPTGSDNVPDGIDSAGDPDFDAVFSQGGTNPQPNDITNVGMLSPYGTAGQGGNVWEHAETESDLTNDLSTSRRDVRGGGWSADSGFLRSSVRGVIPSFAIIDAGVGFRVASIPEPSSLILGLLGVLGVLGRRRRSG